jgi:hypothetical protein
MTKVDVCHRTTDGDFTKITIAEPAYGTHIEHGDAGIGGPVPGLVGYVFDQDCEAVEAVIIVLSTITGGREHSCGLDATGTAYCWGRNTFGQLGDPPSAGFERRFPTGVPGLAIQRLALGGPPRAGSASRKAFTAGGTTATARSATARASTASSRSSSRCRRRAAPLGPLGYRVLLETSDRVRLSLLPPTRAVSLRQRTSRRRLRGAARTTIAQRPGRRRRRLARRNLPIPGLGKGAAGRRLRLLARRFARERARRFRRRRAAGLLLVGHLITLSGSGASTEAARRITEMTGLR